jgi:hypothetical protein
MAATIIQVVNWRFNTQLNDIQKNDIQHTNKNAMQHNGTQINDARHNDTNYRVLLCWMSFISSVLC